jgi:hypothetical protein
MTDFLSKLDEWSALPKPGEDEEAQFSIHLSAPEQGEQIKAAVATISGAHRFLLRPAFPQGFVETGQEEFWILTFPDLKVKGLERFAFQVARLLRVELGAETVRPVLVDSLVGAALAGPPGAADEAILGRFCNSDDAGPQPRGWAPLGLGIRNAWQHTRGGGATVASIDTGVSTHEELKDVTTTAKAHLNLVEGGSDASDRFSNDVLIANPGHGTLVASVVASRGDINANGDTDGSDAVTGSAPEAKILPIRAIRSVVDLRQSRIPAAIEHAILQDVDVIVMALGSAFVIEPVEAALRKAAAAGIVTVCAAGNCYGPVVFPAKLAPQGLTAAIAAVDYAYLPWEKTSKGPEVTVGAFGEAVWGARKGSATDPNDRIAPSQGTTLAASLTAGIAALWVAHHGRDALREKAKAKGVTVQRLFNNAIQRSAYRPSGWPAGMGAGLVNAGELLAYDLDGPSVPADVPTAVTDVTPLSRFLPEAVAQADPLAGLESARVPEDFAAEVLWRFYAGSARSRAQAAGLPPPPPADADAPNHRGISPGLAAQLDSLDRLGKLID